MRKQESKKTGLKTGKVPQAVLDRSVLRPLMLQGVQGPQDIYGVDAAAVSTFDKAREEVQDAYGVDAAIINNLAEVQNVFGMGMLTVHTGGGCLGGGMDPTVEMYLSEQLNSLAAARCQMRFLWVTLMLPAGEPEETVHGIMKRIAAWAKQKHVQICGGHTCVCDGVTRPVISLTGAGPVMAVTDRKTAISSAGIMPAPARKDTKPVTFPMEEENRALLQNAAPGEAAGTYDRASLSNDRSKQAGIKKSIVTHNDLVLVMAGYTGCAGTALLAGKEEKALREYFPSVIIDEALRMGGLAGTANTLRMGERAETANTPQTGERAGTENSCDQHFQRQGGHAPTKEAGTDNRSSLTENRRGMHSDAGNISDDKSKPFIETVTDACVLGLDEIATLGWQLGAVAMHDVSCGGVFGALWELAAREHFGFEVNLKKIPIRQETVEICEWYDKNPYQLYGQGAMLMVMPEKAAQEMRRRLTRPAGRSQAGPGETPAWHGQARTEEMPTGNGQAGPEEREAQLSQAGAGETSVEHAHARPEETPEERSAVVSEQTPEERSAVVSEQTSVEYSQGGPEEMPGERIGKAADADRHDIPVVIIGRIKEGNEKIILNGEEVRYLDKPQQDALYT